MDWNIALQLMIRYGPEAVVRIIEIVNSHPQPTKEAFVALTALALKPMDDYLKEAAERLAKRT